MRIPVYQAVHLILVEINETAIIYGARQSVLIGFLFLATKGQQKNRICHGMRSLYR